uniref:Putative conserved plasma membrane protein n=1 Tax=Nyssomyia neivai TaxID=330878 RepID=A0A1L8DA26_9DIPT
MGTVWETPSPESSTIPVVRPEAYRESTAWMATYMAGALNVSNMIWVIFSLLAFGLRGASVRSTGCSSGATRSSL